MKSNSTVCVLGIGYVGLPLAVAFSNNGFYVNGYDVNHKLVDELNNLDSNSLDVINGVHTAELKSLKGTLRFTSDILECTNSSFYIITVPTPIKNDGSPDLSFIRNAAESILSVIKNGDTIILESTSYPGTTENVVKQILDRSSLVCERDYFLGFSSERIDPGRKDFNIQNTPKVLSGTGQNSLKKIVNLYKEITSTIVTSSNVETAEFSKLLENTYRLVNIALINQLATSLHKTSINIWEAIEIAGTKPFGFTKFYPSAGVGGHCIPVDPYYLKYYLEEVPNISSNEYNILLSALISIKSTPEKILKIFLSECIARDIVTESIILLGATYKQNVADFRNSPTREVLKGLNNKYSCIYIVDPYITKDNQEELYEIFGNDCIFISNITEVVGLNLPSILIQPHDEFKQLVNGDYNFSFILDTCNFVNGENCVKI